MGQFLVRPFPDAKGRAKWPTFLATTLFALGLSAMTNAYAGGEDVATVQVQNGALVGEIGNGYRRFLGVPYARPPVGALRWRSPEPAEPWTGARKALIPPAACPQAPVPGTTAAPSRFNEDCLYLNVTVPTDRRRTGALPVMIWLHGGGFYNGAGADYDARRLATTGEVMVVTVSYRLGMLGFFGYPGLDGSGTFGLQDQQAALRWVRANAAAFGGDPRNITIFGESAGAMSVCAHLVAPSSAGLFDKAILQSGTCLQSWAKGMIWPTAETFHQFVPVAEVETLGESVAQTLGCRDIECLRALPAEELLAPWPVSRPAYGGAMLQVDPAELFRAGHFHAVPIIWGSTRDEWRASAGVFEKMETLTEDTYARIVADAFGERAADILKRYPATTYERAVYAWAAVSTDSAWSCPTLLSAEIAARKSAVYAFEFSDRNAPNPAYVVPDGFSIGAAHATDLSYLFDLGGVKATFTPAQDVLSAQMIGYWAAFAWSGDPNHDGAPPWPRFTDTDSRSVLSLAPSPEGPMPVDFSARHNCDLWRTIATVPRG